MCWRRSWSRISYTAPSRLSSVSFRWHDVAESQVYCSRRMCMLHCTLYLSTTRGGALRWRWNPFRVPDGKPQLKQASTASESRAEASRQHHLQFKHQHPISCCSYIHSISNTLLSPRLSPYKDIWSPSIQHCNPVRPPSTVICNLVP